MFNVTLNNYFSYIVYVFIDIIRILSVDPELDPTFFSIPQNPPWFLFKLACFKFSLFAIAIL